MRGKSSIWLLVKSQQPLIPTPFCLPHLSSVQFTTLLVHQRAIEETLTQHSEVVVEDKLPASRAMYRSVDRKCESMCVSACVWSPILNTRVHTTITCMHQIFTAVGSVGHGQFRHALRRAHHEYQHDPSLLQISMR